jgi:hypothetical protein
VEGTPANYHITKYALHHHRRAKRSYVQAQGQQKQSKQDKEKKQEVVVSSNKSSKKKKGKPQHAPRISSINSSSSYRHPPHWLWLRPHHAQPASPPSPRRRP